MKRLIIYIATLLLILPACTKISDNKGSRFLLAGIKGSKGSEIVCVNVDSGGVVNTTPIDCYVFGSEKLHIPAFVLLHNISRPDT